MPDIQELLSTLTWQNYLTIGLIVGLIIATLALRILQNMHRNDPAFMREQIRKKEAYEKKRKKEMDDLISQVNTGLDMGENFEEYADYRELE